ncbi:flagellar biosynthesis protein FlhF [Halomonas daqiaonensis]|uniref:Flagellar biosynthesis protein FlhF n=1 Tax=Halomonas daqiaonensis TaxID=650850 RepID=A0A1H7STA6_9GAMM|nr:flagellar biosynthesis protein FlhF [Halomonas daqiaonensis]SEL75569.1 flagellar biosynthesis protein FlhF [Halomonas daqiaonensis]
MSVIRFSGNTSREAMRQVRASLGDDALILANRRTEQGVEILAMADGAMEEKTALPAPEALPTSSVPSDPQLGDASADGRALQTMSEQLLHEMQDMRALLAREQARHAPSQDCRSRLKRLLREAGFSALLADELLQALPAELNDCHSNDERPLGWLQRRLAARLPTFDREDGFFDPPGVVSLVGPTGVGKTTTTAKLAARFVQRHGADRVALITTDSFRIGAHEQLRIYADLLGIPMHALAPGQPIDSLARDLRGRRWVIIDTVGMSQRDQRIIEQIAQLQGGRVRVRMVLLLNAASQPETLEEVVTRYRQAARAAGAELDDCLLTKQDEAGRLAPALETIIRHGLRLSFVSHGQRVPEDLAMADPMALTMQSLATRAPLPLDEPSASRPSRGTLGYSPKGDLLGQGRRLSTVLNGLRQRLVGFNDLESAWDISALPDELQAARLDTLLDQSAKTCQRTGMLWASRQTLNGSDWAMPDMGLDAEGQWLVLPDLQHRQPIGQVNRLVKADEVQGVNSHLFPSLPDNDAWRWLNSGQISWSSQVRPGQRVIHGGVRRALSELAPLATPSVQANFRLRGQPCQVALSQLTVTAFPARRKKDVSGKSLEAWFARLRDPESGKELGRRYWLMPFSNHEDALPLLLGHLQAEGLVQQTRSAKERLSPLLPARTRPELQLLLAAGIAATANHLDHGSDVVAMDLRSELLGFLGGRRRRRDTALLEGLLYLFSARDAIRHVGSAGLEGMR